MNFRIPSLTTVLSVAIIFFVSFLLIISMTLDLNNRKNELTNKSLTDIKKQTAKLTRLAERVLIIDPQLLFEDISQEGTDSRVAFAAVILSSGKVLSSTDFSQNGKTFNHLTSFYDEALYKKSLSARTIQLKSQDDSILAYMNFSEPAGRHEVRGLKKGVVVISYDLKKEQDKLFNLILKERLAEIIVSIIIAIVFVIFLRKYIVSPIVKLEESAKLISKGNYKDKLTLTGPVEIQNLTTSFNVMSKSLQNYITDIKENNQHTETILENVIDGIITINTKGIVLSYNKSAEKIFGYKPEEIIGENVNKLMPSNDFSRHDAYLARYMKTGKGRMIGAGSEVKGLRKNQEIFPLEIGISEIERNNERLFVGIARDMSEKHKVDKIKREFVSTVSHELRTPLTAMHGAVMLVASGVLGTLSEKATELLLNAQRNGDRLLTLINDLLDMDKIVEGKVELNINQYEIQELINESIEANISFSKKYSITLNNVSEAETYKVNVDSDRLQQVLSNFISNACKFSHHDNNVEIGVKKMTPTSIRIFVRDFGEGITEEFKPKIFEKFSQADASDTKEKGGTGLGLAISKELIELMSGKIGFISEVEQGSTFYFDLPLA